MTTSSPPAIDILTCSASELSNYLLEHRFENDGLATTAFLLEGTGSLPNAEEIAMQIQESAEAEEDDDDDDEATNNNNVKQGVATLVSSTSSEASPQSTTTAINAKGAIRGALHSAPIEVSLTNPRGKFHVTFHDGGIYMSTIKTPTPLIIPEGSVASMIVFPKPTDCVRTSSTKAAANKSPMMLLCFHDDNDNQQRQVLFKSKPLSQICLPMPITIEEPLQKVTQDLGLDTNDPTEAWIGLVCHSLGIDKKAVFRVQNPTQPTSTPGSKKEWTFQSHQDANKSSTASGMPFVKCYYGVQDGCLFPMRQGLLFFKPPLFVPRSKLHSIACGRGNGASSRYVDMNIVTLEPGKKDSEEDDDEMMETNLEFTNIAREELSVLNDYIHKVLIPAMQEDQKSNATGGTIASDDDDDDEEAIAVDVVDDDDDGGKTEGTRGRSKRRAAREARQQTKQHFLQKKNGASNNDDDDENSNNDENDDDDSEEEDASFCAAENEEEEAGSDDESGAISIVDEDEEEVAKLGGSTGDNEDDDDGEEAEVVEVEAEVEDITETDAEETEEEEDDEDESSPPPPSKKRRSK